MNLTKRGQIPADRLKLIGPVSSKMSPEGRQTWFFNQDEEKSLKHPFANQPNPLTFAVLF